MADSAITDAASYLNSLETGSAEPPTGEPAAQETTQVSAPETAPPKTAGAPNPDPDKMPEFVKEALRRVHERDRVLREREKAIELKERGGQETPKQAWSKARQKANLRQYLKEELGLTPGDAGRAIMSEELGDKSPHEYRALDTKLREQGMTEQMIETLQTELATLREQQQSYTREQAIAHERAIYERGLLQYVGGDIEGTYPSAARAIRADRDGAMGEIWSILQSDAISKINAGGEEPPMTPEEAVKAFETRLAQLSKWITPLQVQASSPTAPKTLANTVSQTVPPPKGDPRDLKVREGEAWDWFNKLP